MTAARPTRFYRLPRAAGVLVFLMGLLFACGGCGGTDGTAYISPLVPPPTRTEVPNPSPAQVTASPISAKPTAPKGEPIELVVLHTNDNWGETEPCG